eukprot:3432320-Prorocentrum_lima.AAC.1
MPVSAPPSSDEVDMTLAHLSSRQPREGAAGHPVRVPWSSLRQPREGAAQPTLLRAAEARAGGSNETPNPGGGALSQRTGRGFL